ncbi:MAG: hypothetical protein ABI402_09955 [Ferruginibacter sp.]
MKQVVFFILVLFTQNAYAQEYDFFPSDSLLKSNNVKRILVKSKKANGKHASENLYYYNHAGSLARHEVIVSFSNEPFIITDYFFDSSGNRYASVMHGGGSHSSYSSTGSWSTWRWTSGFVDSVIYYYEYNRNKQFSRIYRLYPSGKLMSYVLYSYNPKIITRKSYNESQMLTGESIEYYEKDLYINKVLSKTYDSIGAVISTFTQYFTNIYNAGGQLTEVHYSNDTCSCISEFKYLSNGLLKSVSNVSCSWNKKFVYKYHKTTKRHSRKTDDVADKIDEIGNGHKIK